MESRIKPEDLPLILDATFAMAISAYIVTVPKEERDCIGEAFRERFLSQGFDAIQSHGVAGVIQDAFSKACVAYDKVKGGLRGI